MLTKQQNNYEFDTIDPHPDQKDSQVIAFKERYVAENVSTLGCFYHPFFVLL